MMNFKTIFFFSFMSGNILFFILTVEKVAAVNKGKGKKLEIKEQTSEALPDAKINRKMKEKVGASNKGKEKISEFPSHAEIEDTESIGPEISVMKMAEDEFEKQWDYLNENALKDNNVADNLKLCLDVYVTYNILFNGVPLTSKEEFRNAFEVKPLFENENTVTRRILRVVGNNRKNVVCVEVNAFGCRIVFKDMAQDPGSIIFIIAGSNEQSFFLAGPAEEPPKNDANLNTIKEEEDSDLLQLVGYIKLVENAPRKKYNRRFFKYFI